MIDKQIISAKAIILSDGKVLLLQRPNGRWDLPGGKVDNKEQVIVGLQREVKEETGLDVKVKRLISTHIHTDAKGQDVVTLAYLCKAQKTPCEKHIKLSKEHVDFDLFKPGRLKKIDFRAHHKEAILEALAQKSS